MLTILGSEPRGKQARFCDGLSRRNFLRVGGLAMGGLALPQILQAEQASGVAKGHKGIIMIFLPGGPPHQDMWDLKPDAPSEIRGEFNPIRTSVPGIEICELFPRLAGMMQKFVPIRSMVGCDGSHYAYQCLTGWRQRDRQPLGGYPCLGSVLSKVYGPVDPSVPACVGLAPKMGHMPWADNGVPGFLGVAHAPFTPNAEGKADMVLNGVSLDRLSDRKAVRTALDRFRRETDASGQMTGMDAFTEQAFGVLTSSKLAEALDIEKEDQKLRDRYGRGFNQLRDDGGPRLVDNFLIARRLISAGARCVSLAFSRWDWHGANFKQGREDMPLLDQGVTALVEDLEQRGMLDDVSVVVWGEFGRTPKINTSAGRDHWPQVSCALLAGGGMKTGQVIGATNRLGEHATDRPVHFQEVFATLYKNLGISVDHLTLRDLQGRPQFLIDQNAYRPMPELV
ncbi:MAG: DUF1501 domain-containing protein [Planctomycetales bacterium]|nr:DUF1501 domain-containing protein [Planctomycetales bacterium]